MCTRRSCSRSSEWRKRHSIVGATRASPDPDACVARIGRVRGAKPAHSARGWSLEAGSRAAEWFVRSSRRTPRLSGYDYTRPGPYFVSTCTHRRQCVFGRVVDGKVCLSEAGRIVEEEWLHTAEKRPYVTLDSYVIMPNHIHGLIVIHGRLGDEPVRCRQHSLLSIMGAFKAAASRRVATIHGHQGRVLWQRSYHERIVRGDQELGRIRDYIAANPARWSGSA